jgi:hypothetical protein
MFDKQTHWTDSPCYYVMAYSRLRRAWLAGPYPTAKAAEEVLPRARRWAIRQSGDRHAASYRYEVMRHFNGDTHSILWILTS